MIVYSCLVVMVCINLGNSLESTKNRSPSEERYNFFDAELLQMITQKKNTNVVVSPIGIKLVLGMLMEGATNKTANEIRAALRLPDDEKERRKEFNSWLSAFQLNESSNILKIANRMFLSNEYRIDREYEEILKKYYWGGITTVNFRDEKEASRLINGWVSNQTSQLISGIVDEGQIITDNKLVLASAIYFKGFWSNPFASERTGVRCFYSKENKCTDSLMMMETGYFDYGYISRLDAYAISLPYRGGKFSMALFLPSKKSDLEILVRDFMHVSLKSVLSELKEEEVFVQIPRFEISYNEDLVENLKNVQLFEIFNREANFSKIFTTRPESTTVSHIYHSAKIIVNEEGSEAAAATGALFVPLMGGTTTSFVADHPFLFFVINSEKNLILFAGKIISPQISETSRKQIFPVNYKTITSARTQNHQRRNLVNPLLPHEGDPWEWEFTKASYSPDKTFYELRHNERGNQAESIGAFPPSRTPPQPANKSRVSSESTRQFRSSLLRSPARRNFVSRPPVFFEKETRSLQKKGETSQGASRYRKWDDPSDDWRHHVLFFTR